MKEFVIVAWTLCGCFAGFCLGHKFAMNRLYWNRWRILAAMGCLIAVSATGMILIKHAFDKPTPEIEVER